ncbi:MAG: DNA primase [Bacteroidetes bacterium]|jgi:DNA primase|nr:DNA primase [Bacteroidota bacterium]MBU1577966.1 DNA primase [Bacteroidota bacterium]MDA3942234.1 DNA primase [Bacteroidota bacterium]
MIPQNTVSSILEAARIEEVVGEFVSLKRRGSNLIGLCPFHQEKTPSFTVSPAKGIFKCFGCGKAGDSAKFIMEHEHYSYPEALRYLAKKYQIELDEREQTPEEMVAQNEREQMFNLNTFAQQYFSTSLFESEEGKAIGLSYFKERDFREAVIKQFQLGYNPDGRDTFSQYAIKQGYSPEVLLKTGLSTGTAERYYDRFQGRVIFPIHNLTGKVIGFGGRILQSDKSKAKYLNSPESELYNKSKTLYGIYYAKNAISRLDQCLLVEGYTDVISMHQAGIENVVASSGTSLTTDQIRLVRRYTKNITMLYDGDKAGISASLRGTEMILQEGMNVRVAVLPEGEDPDSFVRKNRTADVEEFIRKHSRDFISFKTSLLLEESAHDPIKKAGLVKEIVQTISLIPDPIYRTVYVKECSRLMDVGENTLMNELNKLLRQQLKKELGKELPEPPPVSIEQQQTEEQDTEAKSGYYQERELVKILLHHGSEELNHEELDEQGMPVIYRESVAQFIIEDLLNDKLSFEQETHKKILDIFVKSLEKGIIPGTQVFISNPEPDVALLAVDLLSTPYELHNWERKNIFVKTELEVLQPLITNSLYSYKKKVIEKRRDEVSTMLHEEADEQNQQKLMMEKIKLEKVLIAINKVLGSVITK